MVNDCSPPSFVLDEEVTWININMNKGPANARNVGIEEAIKHNVDLIAFTDVIPSLNWIESMIDFYKINTTCHVVSGNAISYNKTWLGKYHNINGTLNGRRFKNSHLLLYGPTCNLSVVSEALKDIRFNLEFPNAAGEDIEFCFNLLMNGNNIYHSSETNIYHDYSYRLFKMFSNLRKFKRQFTKYAKGEKILLEKIPTYYPYLSETEEITSY